MTMHRLDSDGHDLKETTMCNIDHVTGRVSVIKRKEPLSPSFLSEPRFKGVQTDEYECTVKYRNGVPIIEINDWKGCRAQVNVW